LNEGVSPEDLAALRGQLGRPVRDVLEVAARCVCGNPLVVKTAPRLGDGTPFPTLYYLTEPAATAAVSTLEASGFMAQLQAELASDDSLAAGYLAAHQSYLAEREALADVPELEGISAGGMPTRVKCLHALVAHSLAKGEGFNPIGDRALAALAWSPNRCSCSAKPQ
jgi:uncharacterized protein